MPLALSFLSSHRPLLLCIALYVYIFLSLGMPLSFFISLYASISCCTSQYLPVSLYASYMYPCLCLYPLSPVSLSLSLSLSLLPPPPRPHYAAHQRSAPVPADRQSIGNRNPWSLENIGDRGWRSSTRRDGTRVASASLSISHTRILCLLLPRSYFSLLFQCIVINFSTTQLALRTIPCRLFTLPSLPQSHTCVRCSSNLCLRLPSLMLTLLFQMRSWLSTAHHAPGPLPVLASFFRFLHCDP